MLYFHIKIHSAICPYASFAFTSIVVFFFDECPHKQEVSGSGLSSYDSVHDIESVEHPVAVHQSNNRLIKLISE